MNYLLIKIKSAKRPSFIQHSTFNIRHFSENGQLMLTTVLILGGAMIGASLVAGFLMTRNIRQSTLAKDSAEAIFAADAGIDFLFYQCFKWVDSDGNHTGCQDPTYTFDDTCNNNGVAAFANQSCYIASYHKDADGLFTDMRSVGYSDWQTKLVARSLSVAFQ